MGSSWATFACYASMAAICYALGQKYFPIPYRVINSIAYLVLALALIGVSAYTPISQQFAATAIHTFLLVVYVLIAYLLERKAWNEIG